MGLAEIAERGIGVGRTAKQIALPAGAAELRQPFRLRFHLDAFGNHVHAQALAHRQDGADDVLGRPVLEDRGDEGTVDLELVEAEFA
ncbi:hypothetical protein D9M68_991410 [compost metagenome]